jgi:hypothetical protein
MADATGIVWVEPTEITSLTDETWTTVSAPSVIPSNAKGIFGYWETQSANVGTPRLVGVRHTSDTSRSTLHDTSGGGYAHLFIVGLDGSNQFQYYQENDVEGDQKLFVHGYFTGDVYFKTAAVDLEPNLPESSSWQTDIDLTSDTSASATAVFSPPLYEHGAHNILVILPIVQKIPVVMVTLLLSRWVPGSYWTYRLNLTANKRVKYGCLATWKVALLILLIRM